MECILPEGWLLPWSQGDSSTLQLATSTSWLWVTSRCVVGRHEKVSGVSGTSRRAPVWTKHTLLVWSSQSLQIFVMMMSRQLIWPDVSLYTWESIEVSSQRNHSLHIHIVHLQHIMRQIWQTGWQTITAGFFLQGVHLDSQTHITSTAKGVSDSQTHITSTGATLVYAAFQSLLHWHVQLHFHIYTLYTRHCCLKYHPPNTLPFVFKIKRREVRRIW